MRSLLDTSTAASPLVDPSIRERSITSAFARSIAYSGLASISGVHTSQLSVSETTVSRVQATYFPWPPLIIFWVLVVLYALFSIAILVWVLTAGRARTSDRVQTGSGQQCDGSDVVVRRMLTEPGGMVWDLSDVKALQTIGGEDKDEDMRLLVDETGVRVSSSSSSFRRRGGACV
jgi:hypothetical protein